MAISNCLFSPLLKFPAKFPEKTYAAAYAKNFRRQAIGCGVVLGGHTAINCMMELGSKKS